MNLPDLKGTRTEIDTANNIRDKAVQLFQRSCEIVIYRDMINNINKVYKVMIKKNDAQWWNDRRDYIYSGKWPVSTVIKMGKDLKVFPGDDA